MAAAVGNRGMLEGVLKQYRDKILIALEILPHKKEFMNFLLISKIGQIWTKMSSQRPSKELPRVTRPYHL